ncbi:uncharacterized protein LOC121783774 isoform X2 [Salvia splendens]|uniref:uncharacterized protein LOC121783774 isoform X2 n=1 Tax=Salvia splendens TaxID=180675 RepID=UPI001C259FD2|nr:uncharacterized protein LOC121783774 isoform X2 [Salvia splendens]
MSDIEEETLIIDIPKSQRRMLNKVLVQVRRDKTHIYEPAVVSLGPYHHRRDPQLHLMEPFKDELRDIVCGGDADHKKSHLRKIHEQIDEIRHFYGGADGYTDEELAEMMLRDACFLICYLHGCGIHGNRTDIQMSERMGVSAMLFVSRDILMLENQIPLWIISLIHPQYKSLLCQYLSYACYGDYSMTQLPWTEEEEPLHLLEALRRTSLRLVKTQQNSSLFWRFIKKYNQPWESSKNLTPSELQVLDSPFRSVTDLIAKGIHLRKSSYCLTDISFFSFGLFAQLRLPVFLISDADIVAYSNLIALEMSPGTYTDFGVTSYYNFMKTLIININDVKVLREKGILFSMLASDEKVLHIFKSIDTYGHSNFGLFYEVKMRINEHCNSKAKTWMAELCNTNFRSPWTVMALAAATFLLCLTFLQTYYTINPRN